jgi:hypothetical protein
MKPSRKGAKGRRSPMMPAAGESPASPSASPSVPLAAHLRHLHRYCKGKLPLSVFLVINDNSYGLMFLLSFS